MKKPLVCCVLAAVSVAAAFVSSSQACSRVLQVAADGRVSMARSMDWKENNLPKWWIFPRGMERDGGAEVNPLKWKSQYGSIVISLYDKGVVEGINEKKLLVQGLYLSEAQYGTRDPKIPGLSIMAYAQYLLDNFATVDEAVKALEKHPFQVEAILIGDEPGTAHWVLADASGDNAVVEYINGEQKIHHGKEYKVMCNSPAYDEQLAVNTYWETVGGDVFLPGTYRSSDRFVRATWYLASLPQAPKNSREAVAGVLSVVRNVSVPLGTADKSKPNLAPTIYRTAADLTGNLYFYESTLSPNIVWVDIGKLDLTEGRDVRMLDLKDRPDLAGDVTELFRAAKPFSYR